MQRVCSPYRPLWVIHILLIALYCNEVSAKTQKPKGNSNNEFIPAERPLDAESIFDDFGRSPRLPDSEEKKLWWERMIRGNVGKDRFLILCALKDGNWKRLGDIRDFVEFQIGNIYLSKSWRRLSNSCPRFTGSVSLAERCDDPPVKAGWKKTRMRHFQGSIPNGELSQAFWPFSISY